MIELRTIKLFLTLSVLTAYLLVVGDAARAADAEIMRPRVPPDQIVAAKTITNPLQLTPELLDKGKALYEGTGYCKGCHGADGKGPSRLGSGEDPLARNFTDKEWQAARTDGELFWILKNGSPGTGMAAFIPLMLTEEEAWQVLLYVRSFKGR